MYIEWPLCSMPSFSEEIFGDLPKYFIYLLCIIINVFFLSDKFVFCVFMIFLQWLLHKQPPNSWSCTNIYFFKSIFIVQKSYRKKISYYENPLYFFIAKPFWEYMINDFRIDYSISAIEYSFICYIFFHYYL